MKEIIKKRLLFVLKYFIGVFLLGWILWRVDRRQMVQTLVDLKYSTLLMVILLATVNISTQFYRWKYLIESHSNHFHYKDLIPSFFAGFAFRLMVPGGHAEITKVFMLPGKKRGKVVAFSIEKFFQTYIKFIFVLIAFPFFYPDYQFQLWFIAVAGMLAYFFLPALWGQKFMERFREKELQYKRIFLQTLIYSLAIFISLVFQYYLLLNDAHTLDLWNTALVVTMIWGAGLLPISVSGLGVRENLAVFFLALYSIPASTAVGISLLIFLINTILPALTGAVFIYHRRKELKDAGSEIKSATGKLYRKGRYHLRRKKQGPGQ